MNFSDNEVDRLYRRTAREIAPVAIDAPVLNAACLKARRTRWVRHGLVLLPIAAIAYLLLPGPQPRAVHETFATIALRAELVRIGTPKPATTSNVATYLMGASPYAGDVTDASTPASQEKRP